MKVSLRIFRLSRKVLLILGGVLLLGGAAGAAALYIGKDSLLGPPAESINGLDCTNVTVLKIKKKDRFWIRKYIKTEQADGLTRVKTAMRVAAAVFQKDHPDLVQVVVLDTKGPNERAEIIGHAIGADVIYVPYPDKLADLSDTPVLSAKYMDGMASDVGEFFGQKIHIPEDEAKALISSLTERTDCVDPAPPEGEATKEGEHGAAPAATSEHEAAPAATGEHGAAAPAATGEHEAAPAAEGEHEAAPAAAEEHGAAPAAAEEHGASDEAKPVEGEASAEGETKDAAKKGWLDSVKSMVFGSEEAPEKAEGHEAAPDAEASTGEHGEPGKAEVPKAEDHAAAEPQAEPEAETAAEDVEDHGPEPLPGIDIIPPVEGASEDHTATEAVAEAEAPAETTKEGH